MDPGSRRLSLLPDAAPATPSTAILLEEVSGLARRSEPVTLGVPLPEGAVPVAESLALADPAGRPCPLQVQVLGLWPDRSLRWALLDFPVSLPPFGRAAYELRWDGGGGTPSAHDPRISLSAGPHAVLVDTGAATFAVDRHVFRPFAGIRLAGREVLDREASRVMLVDERGDSCLPEIRQLRVETRGPLRATVRADGVFRAPGGAERAEFTGRVSLYAGRRLAQIRLTLRNPRAALHPGGLWDLGDEGSLYFHDLSLALRLLHRGPTQLAWSLDLAHPPVAGPIRRLEIYQDSSGGGNWYSSSHVDRTNRVPLSFPGYRVLTERGALGAQEGRRATPVVAVRDEALALTLAVPRFWQNFPKALEIREDACTARLFPAQALTAFELQGGEQKTHTVVAEVGEAAEAADLRWTHEPLLARVPPEWWETTRAIPYLAPQAKDPAPELGELVAPAVAGPRSFFERRELIDEYGWRNFGDLYADHEAVGHEGDRPLISHYNNQYDAIQGCLLWYARSGDHRWWELADDLARHVMDIDLYHTRRDRPAFNGGLFWHTEHYTDAGTATHRAYSRRTSGAAHVWQRGGGPSNEHNYTTGLLYYHYLTGDPLAREAVLGLADWVLAMDDGRRTAWGLLDGRPTGLASATVERGYHGPGRGAGNSINACLDAYALTQEGRYLQKAEELIRRCIHPHDDIAARNLPDVEVRWSYLVFLQALGKYLDLKAAQPDAMYAYAQASLLHYAAWMREHEVPYTTILDRVKIPTETWAAQDIRKACVFHFAARHAGPALRQAYRERAEFFFRTCLRDLKSFPTHTLTRPIVLLLVNGPMAAFCGAHPDETAPAASPRSFGRPARFTPQLYALHLARRWVHGLLGAPGTLLRRLGVRP